MQGLRLPSFLETKKKPALAGEVEGLESWVLGTLVLLTVEARWLMLPHVLEARVLGVVAEYPRSGSQHLLASEAVSRVIQARLLVC